MIDNKVLQYKVLQYHDGYNFYYRKLNDMFTINLHYEYDEKYLIERNLKIHTVKRNTDNKIFRLGDKSKKM